MAIAKLSVDLTLGLSQFVGDSGKAARAVEGDQAKMSAAAERFLKSLERQAATATMTRSALLAQRAAQLGVSESASSYIKALESVERRQAAVNAGAKVGAYLGPLLWTAAAGGVATFLTGSAKAVDALNGLSAASGSSVENLSALDSLARRTGFGFGDLQQLVLQLNKSLEAEPNSGAGRALKALGLDAAELRRQDPSEALRQVSVALAGFADNGKKGRLQQALLGRTTKESADFLRDLAGQTKLNATLTREQAEAAEAYTKALATLKAQTEDSARSLTLKLAPALTQILQGFNTAGIRGAGDAIGELVGLGAAYYERRGIDRMAGDLADLEAQAKRLRTVVTRSPSSPLATELEQVEGQIRERTAAIAAARAKYLRLTDGSAGGGRGFVNPERVRPSLPDLGDTDRQGKAADRAAEAYARLRSSIGERIAAAQAELDSGEKLTAAQSFALDVVGKLADRSAKLTDAQKQEATAALETLLSLEQQNLARAAAAKSAEDWSRAVERQRDGLVRELGQIDETNRALREQIEVIGLDADAVERLQLARAAEALAAREAAIAIERASGVASVNADETDAVTAALQRQLELRGQLVEKARAAAELEPLRDASRSAAQGLAQVAGDAVVKFTTLRETIASVEQVLLRVGTRLLVEQPLERGLEGFFRQATEGANPVGNTLRGVLGIGAGNAGQAAAQTAAQAAQTAAVTTSTTSLTTMTAAATAAAAALAQVAGTSGVNAAGGLVGLFGGGAGTGLEGMSSDALAYFFHEGGVVGAGGRAARVPAMAFAGARRYHGGGIAGLAADEVPSVLRIGEEVVKRSDPRHRANGGSSSSAPAREAPMRPLVQHFHFDTPLDRRTQAQVGADAMRGLQRAQRNL